MPDAPFGFAPDYDPFEAAASRQRQAVKPEAGRVEGPWTQILQQYLPHVLGNMATLPQRALDASEAMRGGYGYDPGPILETAGMMVGSPGVPRGALGSSVAKPPGIRAYHGSPHDFDRFDLSKIGTGEGAQASSPMQLKQAAPATTSYSTISS